MSLIKMLLSYWNNLLCFVFGHSLTNICTRCGRVVNLKGTQRKTVEERINGWWKSERFQKKKTYKGSLKLKTGQKKYSINIKTNELRLVDYDLEYEKDSHGIDTDKVIKRNADYNPFLVYIDASNDENAIRKANNYLFDLKEGVKVTKVSKA